MSDQLDLRASVFVPLSSRGLKFLRAYPESLLQTAEHVELAYPQFQFVGLDLVVGKQEADFIKAAMKLARLSYREFDEVTQPKKMGVRHNPRRRSRRHH